MGISEILARIPNIISSLYDLIIFVSPNDNNFYSIKYDGEKIQVSNPKDLKELNKILSKEEIDLINNENDHESIVKNLDNIDVLMNIKTSEYYKFVFINNLAQEIKDEESTKPVILIADDSPIITKFFAKTFKGEFEIIIAHDGEEAIKLIDENKDKLMGVFLDLQMPKKDGYEVLDYFEENELFKSIPVSIISGEDSKDGISKATSRPGVVDMLSKPFSAEAARAIVNKTISFSNKSK